MGNIIEIYNLIKRYDGDTVIGGVNLAIESDEIVAVLGPSGCGKSTLLHLVNGLDSPSTGSIHTRPDRLGGRSGPIAHVFQDATLLPWRTALGNVAFPLEREGLPRAERERRAAEALARVGLAEFAGRYPDSLSGGMRQRVNLARALATRPAALLMDEPLAALDQLTKERLLIDFVRIWTETPFTCLYVTHDPAEAVRIGHRVVVLTPRPARIREIVPIDLPIDKRSESHPTLVAARNRIWELVRTSD